MFIITWFFIVNMRKPTQVLIVVLFFAGLWFSSSTTQDPPEGAYWVGEKDVEYSYTSNGTFIVGYVNGTIFERFEADRAVNENWSDTDSAQCAGNFGNSNTGYVTIDITNSLPPSSEIKKIRNIAKLGNCGCADPSNCKLFQWNYTSSSWVEIYDYDSDIPCGTSKTVPVTYTAYPDYFQNGFEKHRFRLTTGYSTTMLHEDKIDFYVEYVPNPTLSVDVGWNLISLPFNNTYNAETLCQAIPGCTVISKFENQKYVSHIKGLPFNMFVIELGYGFFLHSNQISTLSLNGSRITTSTRNITIELERGWNIIAWTSETNTTAETVCDDVHYIARYDPSTGFTTHLKGNPSNNFTVSDCKGYFVWVNQTVNWTHN